ncbi:MAG: CBS and ACT domain-containing protein [Syntrophobacteraceae bacterium]|jgi:acetoin utilization protein AcuB
MLVKNWMSKNVVTIDVNSSMQDAINLMKENEIRMLPVMKKGQLVGIITDGDIKKASASDATTLDVHELLYLLSKVKISSIMTKNPITVPPDCTVEEAAELFVNRRISTLPVVDDNGAVIGVITQDDLFKVLITLTGLKKRGFQFAFQIEDKPGRTPELTNIIRAYGGRLVSILTSYEDAPEGWRNIYIRAYDIDRSKIPQLMADLKAKGQMLYMVDHRDNKREIFV